MLQMEPLDPDFPILKQLGDNTSPVILVNILSVAEADIDDLTKAWEKDANWMKLQPGFISTQLHRAVGESAMFMNYAVWESVAHFRAAFAHPEFQSALADYPDSAVARPHLFERVQVPNLCTS